MRLLFQVDEKQKTVLLSEQGYEDAEEILDVKDLYDPREQWASYVLNAIKAKELFLRDVNYIIRGTEVLIVDEFTGRVMQVIFIYHGPILLANFTQLYLVNIFECFSRILIFKIRLNVICKQNSFIKFKNACSKNTT